MTEPKSFFTSDFHLFHHNCIKFSNRPFSNVEEMNRIILNNLNEKVEEQDWLYFLGDLSFSGPDETIRWLNQVRCKKICFIRGNHDKTAHNIRNKFHWFKDYAEIKVEDQTIVLMHYAMKTWLKSHYGSWQLYGHSHGSLPDDPNSLSMDVGVDTNNFYPYSFDDIKRKMNKKTFKPIDHHGRKND